MKYSLDSRSVFAFFAAGALAMTACGSSSGGASSPDASGDVVSDVVNNDSPPPCPETVPSASDPCTNGGQQGGGCDYSNPSGCGVITCSCLGGGPWRCFTGGGSCDAGGTDGPASDGPISDGPISDGDTCPADPPPVGGSCSGGLSCSYCDGGALCDCNQGQWECGGAISCMSGHD